MPISKLRVCLLQTGLHWQNQTANLAMLEEKLSQLVGKANVIVLPEMFNSGFSMQPQDFLPHHNTDVARWIVNQSKSTGALVIGSASVNEHGSFRNRLYAAKPDGGLQHYDKRHLFSMAGEHKVYTPGAERIIIDYLGWKICPLVCYDLRFPAFSRNLDNSYDLLLFVANWPQQRNLAWEALLKARAIENLSYVAGVNIIGSDANGNRYVGNSQILSYMGETMMHLESQEVAEVLSLSHEALEDFRAAFPAHLDADCFTIHNATPIQLT
jgi:omega-amidase